MQYGQLEDLFALYGWTYVYEGEGYVPTPNAAPLRRDERIYTLRPGGYSVLDHVTVRTGWINDSVTILIWEASGRHHLRPTVRFGTADGYDIPVAWRATTHLGWLVELLADENDTTRKPMS